MPIPSTENGITALITTHRRPEQLARAIESAGSQGPMIREILVCEDGADATTRLVVEHLQRSDARIRHINVFSRAKGPAEGRNTGIENATSPWIAFLDDDDVWLASKTAVQSTFMSDADIICSNGLRMSGGPYFPPHHNPRFRPESIVRANSIITSSAIVRRSILTASAGFIEEPWARGAEDCILWSHLSRAGARFRFASDPLVLYDDYGDQRLSGEKARVSFALVRTSAQALGSIPPRLEWGPVLGYHALSTLRSAMSLRNARRM